MLLKKILLSGAGMVLTIGITSSSYAYEHWHTRHVWTHCGGGVCHKHVRTYNKKCVNGSCKVWRNHYRYTWRR